MKTRSLIAIAIVALFCASGLQAQLSTQFHAGANVGYTVASESVVKGGYAIGVNGGVTIQKQHIAELEVLYLKNNLDLPFGLSGNFTTIPVLATYRYEFAFANTPWSVQGGGSVGFANKKMKIESDSESKTVLAFGAQALGVYKINDKFSANAGIKWIWTDKCESDDKVLSFTMFTVGGVFRF